MSAPSWASLSLLQLLWPPHSSTRGAGGCARGCVGAAAAVIAASEAARIAAH